MKKIYNLFLISVLFLSVNVYAEPSCNDSSYWSNETIVEDGALQANSGGGLVYDVEGVGVTNDSFSLRGWIFNKGMDNSLDGSNAAVEFKAVHDETGEEIAFDSTQYTNSGNDLKYWTCYRTSHNSSNSGQCKSSGTKSLTGGFDASLDLTKLKEKGTYTIKMKWRGPGRPTLNGSTYDGGWMDVAVSDYAAGVSEVKNYSGNGDMNITISGFGTTATIVAGEARPLGNSGTWCDSFEGMSLSDKGSVYFSKGSTYTIGSRAIRRTRGGGTSGEINLYPVQVNGNGSPGSGYTVYAPATWLQVNGSIKITIEPEEETEEVIPPEECSGEETYTFHYFFLAELYPDTSYLPNTASSAKWGDDYIFKNIIGIENRNELSDFTEGYVTITKDGIGGRYDLDWFYDNLKDAVNSPDKFSQNGNEFYITYDTWTNTETGAGGENPLGKINKSDVINKNVKASQVNIIRMDGEGLGFNFNIDRYFPKTKKKIIDNKTYSQKTNRDQIYHPAVYTMMFCKPKEKPVSPKCPDDVQSAVCLPGDVGTHVVFHENKDIETCTLKSGTHSGFTIVNEEEDTTSPAGTEFGRVACKEDLDFYLPTSKQTAAGQYFLLDRDVDYPNPHIKALRTCATSQVKYSDLDKDLNENYEQPEQLEYLYNVYRDHLYVYNNFPSGPETEEREASCVDDDGNAYTYTAIDWEVPNDGITAGDTPNGEYGYAGKKGTYIPNPPSECVGLNSSKTPQEEWKDEYDREKAKTWAAKAAYDNMLKRYHLTVLAYNKMFSWEDTVMNTNYHEEGSIQNSAWIDTATAYIDTHYTFKPTVTFYYPDQDGNVFPVEYEYPVTLQDPEKDKNYWSEGSKPDSYYESPNGGKIATKKVRKLTNCRVGGDTCRTFTVSVEFHRNSALRRDELIEYDYNLPTVYTIVPNGKVMTAKPSRAHLTLDPEAVPVNINTYAGTYEYRITIRDLKDQLRKTYYNMKNNNPDDDWAESPPNSNETRFIKRKVLNAGQKYICNYKVINDIYMPIHPNEHFNFFYRIIDTEDINPNNRVLGYNWTDGRGDTVQELMIRNEQSYQRLTNSPDVDKFVFTLTPSIMKQIRTYNASRAYSDGYADWDLNCSDYDMTGGYHCYSNFLNCLTGGSGEAGQLSCGQVLGDTFSTALNTEFESKKSNYTLQDLQDNRRILINKQNGIDGRGVMIP